LRFKEGDDHGGRHEVNFDHQEVGCDQRSVDYVSHQEEDYHRGGVTVAIGEKEARYDRSISVAVGLAIAVPGRVGVSVAFAC
jgi:hypothetical protein